MGFVEGISVGIFHRLGDRGEKISVGLPNEYSPNTVKRFSFFVLSFPRSFPFLFTIFSRKFRIPFSQRFRASVLFYLRSLSGIVAASGTISISAKLHDKATDIRATDYKWLEAARRIVATGDEAAIVVHYC